METPVVFISSTCEDLQRRGYRDAARDAAIAAGFRPEMQEYWTAKDNPPLKECLAKVAKADVLVVIVAHRFGWVPHDQSEADPQKRRSITWLECEKAKEILAFLVDDEKSQWPVELREEHELAVAVQEGRFKPELGTDIQWRVNRLKDFKKWLGDRAIVKTFTTREDLRGRIESALWQWRVDHGLVDKHRRRGDPSAYLRLLREETSHIDIRGLQVESGKAQRFGIDELYIPLTTTSGGEAELPRGKRGDKKKEAQLHLEDRKPIALHRALEDPTLVILGDPGTGKTTFLRRIAFGLCNSKLGLDAGTTAQTLGLREQPFPLLVPISELADHIGKCADKGQGPHAKTSPAWLAHFLAAASADAKTGLDQDFFVEAIADGPAMILLDGLDETPSRQQREGIAELIGKAARQFAKCRFVVTSRPPAFEGRAVLPDFAQVRIDPLEDGAIKGFLAKWCGALFVGSERQAREHRDELLQALRSRVEIRRMARNPVMLTALAVVHWHEKRLPEQRADLYESIITWLSRSRERRKDRLPAGVCVNRLQEVALAMQDHAEGRQVQVPRRWAAERIAGEWSEGPERKRIETAETFLAEEELDSGIVVRRGDEIRFWHLTFQEFLAARAIGARPEKEAKGILLAPPEGPKLYLPAWREVVLLLAGVLHKQGHRKVDAFLSAVLDGACASGTLADQARCAGLLGAAVRDLAAVGYRPADPRYPQLLDRVMAIFDAERAKGIDIKVLIEAAEALGQAGDLRFIDEAARAGNWVSIPAGEFLMGAQKKGPSKPNYDPEAYSDESPVHRVVLEAYRIGRYPVTVGEYLRFVEAAGYGDRRFWAAEGFGEWPEPEGWAEQLAHPSRPVTGVSWHEAAAYAAWAGSRLPTEAEWERAARGPDARHYPWGDEEANPLRLNYDGNIGCPTPVGIYARGATPDGILDMAGNVWEWCSDWFGEGYYAKSPAEAPQGPGSGSVRVLRGGAWDGIPGYCRSTCRGGGGPRARSGGFGFRVVWSFGPGLPK